MSDQNKYKSITPYLIVKDAAAAVEFYKKAFQATEIMCMKMPDGKVVHAELQIGDSMFMLADEHPEMGAVSPTTLKGTAVFLHIYVDNVDAFIENASKAGLKTISPLKNQFYGDRSGNFEDPFGHSWSIATRVEEVSDDEVKKRFDEMLKQGTSCH